ncbi:4-(cytidine 5'-diphospho)-2-C-methyl-D-erythritol kinase [Kingella sp. (in: b-proteobacteria)]|uniref:4-(cytidine 5'-diphospho)-2-C-methyl-D-erythritol kinase n=1 Tax=Kingella sp. (in: b-proteobacteria) TaxID=2020713 RepID=UPI0026DD6D81|nr:4-(cytidine 5'-diphospho)-2-C-methyl-D-erythritol kinase [Kingella sp. (in: b-proteobacteria)]MDO4658053.1 4-(cytidine 5'-diphospho)-2-C-methyl-D-erythritol kinase [Kingella sp. (in: b-proteobacteria)]
MPPPHLPHYPAPAKLNLDLRIIRQRPDGYHDIESIFTLINLADTLAIAPRHDNQLILHTPTPNVPPAQDLTIRAAQALRQAAQGSLKANKTPLGADIWLHKTIPMGGGLGGGSSNAATVLLVLNHLWQRHFSPEQLIQIATPLGADVPFFIYGQTAFARGIGEQLQPIAIPPQHYVLVRPNAHIPTAQIFQHPKLPRNSPSTPNPSYAALQPLRNDMQNIVLQNYPAVATAYRQLQAYGTPQLTGSGACLFLPTDTLAAAQHIQSQLPTSLESWAVSPLPIHPLKTYFQK